MTILYTHKMACFKRSSKILLISMNEAIEIINKKHEIPKSINKTIRKKKNKDSFTVDHTDMMLLKKIGRINNRKVYATTFDDIDDNGEDELDKMFEKMTVSKKKTRR
jgi:hypothetical protein